MPTDPEDAMEGNITRKNAPRLRVPVLPEEEALIKANAHQAGLPVAVYLRNIAMGRPVQSRLDYEAVKDLAKVNADLGRLGGLLKMWLANDEKLARFHPVQVKQTILGVLKDIGELQVALKEKVKRL